MGLSLEQPVLAECKSMGDEEFTGCSVGPEDISFELSRPECNFEERIELKSRCGKQSALVELFSDQDKEWKSMGGF